MFQPIDYPVNPEHWATWKAKGNALLAEKGNGPA